MTTVISTASNMLEEKKFTRANMERRYLLHSQDNATQALLDSVDKQTNQPDDARSRKKLTTGPTDGR